MISYWGVDHGFEVSKASKRDADYLKNHARANAALGALPGVYGLAGSTTHAAVKAKPGRKGKAALRAGGGQFLGQTAGSIAGLAAGAPGVLAGSIAGGAGGAYAGSRRNVSRGDIEPLSARKKRLNYS